MPSPRSVRTRPHRRGAAAAGLLLAVVALSGCSGEDDKTATTDSAQSSTKADEAASVAVDTLVQTGLDQLSTGNTTAARGTFASVLALDPDNVLGHYNLGVIQQQAGQEAKAVASYDAALATEPHHVPSLFNKAILLESDDLPASVELYRQVVEIDDQRAAAFMRMGFAMVHLGDTKDGEAALEQGLRLDPAMAQVKAPRYN